MQAVEPMSAAEQPADQLELARAYRARGWRPFPLAYGTKDRPLVKWGDVTEHPATDEQLEAWFGGEPRNIGLATGPSGLVVVDADTMTALAQAAAEAGAIMPTTYTVLTGKGRHYYFADPDREFGNSSGALKPYGIDVRGGHGKGGYVLAPGSKHPSGALYRVEVDAPVSAMLPWIKAAIRDGAPATVTPLPGIAPLGNTPALGSRLENADAGPRTFTKAQAQQFVADHVTGPMRAAAEGGRNIQLNDSTVTLMHFVPAFLDAEQAREWMIAEGLRAGLPAEEVAKTVASGMAKVPDWTAVPVPDVLADPEPEPDGVPEGGTDALKRLLAAEWAREEFARQRGAAAPEPASTSLTDLLAEELEGEDWRITGLWPAEGKVLLAAPRKAGKTTLTGNLVRCLVDGDPFLGGEGSEGFRVAPTGRRVVVLDFEMTRRQLQRWMRDQAIVKTDLVHVELLRGKRWDPTDPAERGRWAEYLRGLDAGTLVIDPAGPIVAALDRDESGNGDVRRFLGALDALVVESGADELFVTHHTGHQGERSRGASAWEDWPDAIWRLAGDIESGTFFGALGRDVDQASQELIYDRTTRRIRLGEATRAAARSSQDAEKVGKLVSARPGMKDGELRLELAAKGVGNNDRKSEAIRAAVGDSVHTHQIGRARCYFTVGQCYAGCPGEVSSPSSPSSPNLSQG